MTAPAEYSALEGATDSLKAVLEAHITHSDWQLHGVPIDVRSPKEIKKDKERVEEPIVSLWLYRVARNGDLQNRPPDRDGAGRLMRQPIPLDLHYLITPLAGTPGDEQLLLGRVLQALNDHSIMRGAELASPLVPEIDELRVSLEMLSLEDVTRIWNALQTPYDLSVSYLAQIVSIESHHDPLRTSSVLDRESEYHQIVGTAAR